MKIQDNTLQLQIEVRFDEAEELNKLAIGSVDTAKNTANRFKNLMNLIITTPYSGCAHDNCTSCNGTGIKNNGLGACIHMLVCHCPKCSITCIS